MHTKAAPAIGLLQGLRPSSLIPQAGAEEASMALEAAEERSPRVDQAELLMKTFDFDVFPLAEAEPKKQEASALPEAAAKAEAKKERTPEWMGSGCCAGRKALDVLACVGCGGRRRVLADVTAPSGVRAMVEHLGLPQADPRAWA